MLQKSDFLLRSDIVFLNHGSFGACPISVIAEQRRWQDRMEQQPVLFFRELPELLKGARKRLAEFIGAQADDVVFVSNSTYAVNVAAHAASRWLQPGDEVVTTDHEYEACDYAWTEHLKGTGATIVRARIPMPVSSQADIEERIWSAVTPRTKVLFFSHITSPTAIVFPVEALCRRARERNIITIVDGAHAIGHLPLNVKDVGADFYTSNCHKWMCAPKGSAFMWISPNVQHLFTPLVTSWGQKMVAENAGELVLAHEYLGTRDPSPFLTVPFILDWMEANDWPRIQKNAQDVTTSGMQLLAGIDGVQMMSGSNPPIQMFAVILPQNTDTDALKNRLYDESHIEVVVQPWLGTPLLRASAHAHTSLSDMSALRAAL